MSSNGEEKQFKDEIKKETSWMQKWYKKEIFWQRVFTVGAIGWMVVLPMVLGGYLGHYLDTLTIGPKSVSWTITFILIGLMIAIYSIWKVYIYKK